MSNNRVHIHSTQNKDIYVLEVFQGLTFALLHSHSMFCIYVQLINKYRDGSYLCVYGSGIQQPHGVGKLILCTTCSLHYSRSSFWATEWPAIFTTAILCSMESWPCFNSLQPNIIHEENSIIKISATKFWVLFMQGQHCKLSIFSYCKVNDFTSTPITSVSIYCTTCKD